jgi:hypothetical protein
MRYGGIALVTWIATCASRPRQPLQFFMSAPLRNSFARWSTRSCHLLKSIWQNPHRDLMYCASDFHMSMLAVILQSCLLKSAMFHVCHYPKVGLEVESYSHQSQVLPEMVFSIKRSAFDAFLLTGLVVVRSQMLFTGLQSVTIDTLALASCLIDNYFA